MTDSLSWRPERPCREEVSNVVRFIKDSLLAAGLTFTAEQDEDENPDCWVIAALDKSDYQNLVLVSWNEGLGGVVYAAFKAEVARRDEMEGIGEDESLAWWRPQTAEQAVMVLTGEVREILARFRQAQFRVLDGGEAEEQAEAA